MNAKPRIALMLSGLTRQWRRCLPSQLALLRDYPVDVFFYFWDTIDAKEKQEIVDLLKPRAYAFAPPQDFSALDSDPTINPDLINVPSRMFSQYTGWRNVGKLVEPYRNEYQLGMRSRADLQFVYTIDHIIPMLKPNDILIPWWEEGKLLSDIFAIGAIEPILYYHTLIDHVREYTKTRQFNSELMLTAHFEQRRDIHVYTDAAKYFFVRRPHMENYTVEQAMLEDPGCNKWLDPEVVQAHSDYHQQQKGEEGALYVKDFRHVHLNKLVEDVKQKLSEKK